MAEQLKKVYNEGYLQSLAKTCKKVDSKFDSKSLVNLINEPQWSEWSLMDRLHGITDRLNELISGDYEKQIEKLKKIAPEFSGFEAMFFPDFAERFGMSKPEISIPYLKFVTQFSSSEFAIRRFILQDTSQVMRLMLEWTKDSNHHVRRLASEGCRPRLPWSINLPDFIENPDPIFPILEKLKADDSKYVQKSVANNLNDISKDHPKKIITIAIKWSGHHPNTDWIVKHASRTLLKSGEPQIMPVFGFRDPAQIKVTKFAIDNNDLAIGDITRFSANIQNTGDSSSKLRLEYIVGYPRKTGTYKKVFFLKEVTLGADKTLNVFGKLDFEEKSTRKIYPGDLSVELQINGKILYSQILKLKD